MKSNDMLILVQEKLLVLMIIVRICGLQCNISVHTYCVLLEQAHYIVPSLTFLYDCRFEAAFCCMYEVIINCCLPTLV